MFTVNAFSFSTDVFATLVSVVRLSMWKEAVVEPPTSKISTCALPLACSSTSRFIFTSTDFRLSLVNESFHVMPLVNAVPPPTPNSTLSESRLSSAKSPICALLEG